MGVLSEQRPVKLVSSIIFKEDKHLEEAERKLKRTYGQTESIERWLPFDKTDYYYEELGRPLRRKFICFKKLVKKDKIYKIKLVTNRIEDRLRRRGKRLVNIDPGYVTEAKLVLLTTKDYTHRVYVAGRIFAESTLFYQEDTFKPWPWTYPDYASAEAVAYFNEIRQLYMKDTRGI